MELPDPARGWGDDQHPGVDHLLDPHRGRRHLRARPDAVRQLDRRRRRIRELRPATSACPVARVKIALFALTGLSAAILAAIQTTRFTSADILRGTGYELDAITTAVIGGSLLTGGYGSVAGTALGALALGMARQGIVFADINADWYKIAIGTLLLVAVVLNGWIRRKFAGLT